MKNKYVQIRSKHVFVDCWFARFTWTTHHMFLYFPITLLEGEILPCYPRLIKIQDKILDLSVTLPVECGNLPVEVGFHHFNKCCQKHSTLIFLNLKDLNSFNIFEETVSVASREHSLFFFPQSNSILRRVSILFSNCTIFIPLTLNSPIGRVYTAGPSSYLF